MNEINNLGADTDDPSLAAIYYFRLGEAFQRRFEEARDIADLDKAVEAGCKAVELSPKDDPNRPLFLSSLGDACGSRFKQSRNIEDLEAELKAIAEASETTPHDHPNKAVYLSNLSDVAQRHFQETYLLNDLHTAVNASMEAVKLTAENHPSIHLRLNNLSNALIRRFDYLRSMDDLRVGIELNKKVLDSTSKDNPHRAIYLNSIGSMLMKKYDETESFDTLEEAISALKEAVEVSVNSPNRSVYLNNLSAALKSRTEWKKSSDDLDDGIKVIEEVLASTSNEVNRALSLYNFSILLQKRFNKTKLKIDLDAAVAAGEEAVELIPINHSDRPLLLQNLGQSLQKRYVWNKSGSDLDAALDAMQKAVELAPKGHHDRAAYLNSLGNILRLRFKWIGDINDLARAVDVLKEAVGLAPDNGRYLDTLGVILEERFERLGSMADLNAAIKASREAVASTPENHPERLRRLSSLSNSLQLRYDRVGSMQDLNEVLRVIELALESAAADDRLMLSANMGNALLCRFERSNSIVDLNNAVDMYEETVKSTAAGHPYRLMFLTNLSNALKLRFESAGSSDDIESAIKYSREAVELSDSHPNKVSYLLNFGVALQSRFEQTKSMTDLNDAIETYKKAKRLVPEGDRKRVKCLVNLGLALESRFHQSGIQQDNIEAVSALEASVGVNEAPPTVRIKAARAVAELLMEDEIPHASRLLRIAVELLPKASPRSLAWSDQEHTLSSFDGLASDAVALALQSGSSASEAVRLLDSGRNIIQGHRLDTRTQLKCLPPDLSKEYENMQSILDSQRQPESSIPVDLHQMELDFDALLRKIRQMDAFRHFGMPLPDAELKRQASHGPIVVLNIHQLRCDALIVKDSCFTNIQLTKLNFDETKLQVERFQSAIQEITRSMSSAQQKTEERRETLSKAERSIFRVLEWLWDSIAEPVLHELNYKSKPNDTSSWPRIWWCPTGLISFLPIHAAGYHGEIDRTVMDRVISAYTSSIRTLKYSRDNVIPFEQHKVFVVAMSNTPEIPSVRRRLAPLSLAKDEAFGIRGIWRQVTNTRIAVKKQPTRQEVLSELQNQTVVHLVCHADADEKDPSSSALMVEDGSITVAQISESNIRSGALVYLSACSTALSRATELIDEAITLTTAFQIAGFSRIVGTLWNASDHVAFEVATLFYRAMGGDLDKAAEALHSAVCEQRKKYHDKPSMWASYIYTGV